MDQNNSNLFDLQIDHQGTAFLKEAAKWARFLSIVGFIFCGLLALAAIFGGRYLASSFQDVYGEASSAIGIVLTVVYLIGALLYFFPCLYFYNFGTKMKAALANNDLEQLNASFKNLKSCFKFVGILTIIILSLWALILLLNIATIGSRL